MIKKQNSKSGVINMTKKSGTDKFVVDFFTLYKEIYPELVQYAGDNRILNNLQNFPCSFEQLEAVISNYSRSKTKKINAKKTKSNEVSESIKQINNVDALRTFYYEHILGYFDSSSDENTKKQIINSISLNELRYLYSIISNIELPVSKKKVEILSFIRVYFENESRTNSLRF